METMIDVNGRNGRAASLCASGVQCIECTSSQTIVTVIVPVSVIAAVGGAVVVVKLSEKLKQINPQLYLLMRLTQLLQIERRQMVKSRGELLHSFLLLWTESKVEDK